MEISANVEKKTVIVFSIKDKKTRLHQVFLGFSFILGCAFIIYAKHKATKVLGYITHLSTPVRDYLAIESGW